MPQTKNARTAIGRAGVANPSRKLNARHEPTFPILVSIIGPRGLTAEFEMGSGVAPWVCAPGKKKEQGLSQMDYENESRSASRCRSIPGADGLPSAKCSHLSCLRSACAVTEEREKVVKPIGQLVPVR